MSIHHDFLANVEKMGANSELEKLYLWPAVDMWKLTSKEIQKYITQRVGASDYAVEDPSSRPYRIIDKIQNLVAAGTVSESFSFLDITCGDGVNLWQIKKSFPSAHLYGIDCCTDAIDSHGMVREANVTLFKGYIQHLFAQNITSPFDIVMMLNTYRGWESAKLRDHEKALPSLADAWFDKNTRLLILTATDRQISLFKKRGYKIAKMGKGEDQSSLVCLSKEQNIVKRFLRKFV